MADLDPDLHLPPRRILVLVDGDPPAAGAFDHAAALAAALEAELVLLGVDAPELDEAPTATVLAANRAMDRLTRERALAARDQVPAGVRTRVIFGVGPAGRAIVDAARAEAADLIVVPMRGGGELSHLLNDGTDRYVLHHGELPVLVVPEA
jgi:nucleotide-binding universal stress UspA family protein